MEDFAETAALPRFLATAVGSMPHRDAREAVDLSFSSLTKAPHVPQVPRCDPREQMWIQFTEGLPGFKVDLEQLKYRFDTSDDTAEEVEQFFAHYLEVIEGAPPDRVSIGEEYGRGIHRFLNRLEQDGKHYPFIKLQVTGPLTFALGIADQSEKPVFFHPLFKDVAVKGMGLKAMWLIEQFKPFAEQIIMFFDEPTLSAYGSSAMLGVSREDVITALDEVIDMASSRGAICGVHCCGNTDWGLLMESSTRILNFDAVAYMDTLALYPTHLREFLDRGGVLAWGAVPNTPEITGETADTVINRIRAGVDLLVEKSGADKETLTSKMIVTPACGCGSLSVEFTEKVYRVLADLDEGSWEEKW
ncbi:MAG: hypothetical protein AB1646_25580 [Thermodesulfobacteriota bacterium]